MRVFTDSDVVISSLLSSSGAAYLIVNQSKIKPVISSISKKALQIVAKRLGLDIKKFQRLVSKRFEVFEIKESLKALKKQYRTYVTDVDDAQIVAGAYLAKVSYLISYNLKDYKADKIKEDLGISLMTPALFLQYLRSLKN